MGDLKCTKIQSFGGLYHFKPSQVKHSSYILFIYIPIYIYFLFIYVSSIVEIYFIYLYFKQSSNIYIHLYIKQSLARSFFSAKFLYRRDTTFLLYDIVRHKIRINPTYLAMASYDVVQYENRVSNGDLNG
jgi:hypothetical protein